MHCFKNEWRVNSFENAQHRPEAGSLVFMPFIKEKTSRKVGDGKSDGKRFPTYPASPIFLQERNQKICFLFGTISSLGHSSNAVFPTDSSRQKVSSLSCHQKGIAHTTMKGYKGESLLAINLGKIGEFDKVMCHNADLIPLLKTLGFECPGGGFQKDHCHRCPLSYIANP